MDQALVQLLSRAGFSEKEAFVYLALLELGRGTVTDVSKKTGLKRSIIYVVLEGLIARAYASVVPSSKILTYSAADPSVILANVQTTAKQLSEMLGFLRLLGGGGERRPNIQYAETKEAIWNIYESITKAKETYFISSYARIEECFPGAVASWAKEYKRKVFAGKGLHLIPDTDTERAFSKPLIEAGEQVRTSENLGDVTIDISIFDDKIALTSFEQKPFLVLVQSRAIAHTLQSLFLAIWENAKPIERKSETL